MNREIEKLQQMLSRGTSAAMAVAESERQLKEAGFEELHFQESWNLCRGGNYYLKYHDTTLFAFRIGDTMGERDGFRMAAAHTDYPCLRIKPAPDMESAGYGQINVEVYGGPILNTWLDRPLGISGRVAVKSEDIFHPKMCLVDIRKPAAVIPNLAIHLNREVNKGVAINEQTELLPIISTEKGDFLAFLADEMGLEKESILDYELWLTCLQEPQLTGIKDEMLVSPRLDNLTSVQALVSALIDGTRGQGINLIALFDHEEVGSRSKQGAGSLMLLHLMEKICECLGKMGNAAKESIYDSILLSVDVAQGTHPNYLGKMDPTTRPVLNGGFCIKEACSQAYATDCGAVAVVEQICQSKNIPYQKFVNRSDVRGGGTLGAIASSIVPIPTVDIGVPLLAMHSAVETMGAKDQIAITDLIREFFSIS